MGEGGAIAFPPIGDAVVSMFDIPPPPRIHVGDPSMPEFQQVLRQLPSAAALVDVDRVGLEGGVHVDGRYVAVGNSTSQGRGDIPGVVDKQPVDGILLEDQRDGLLAAEGFIGQLGHQQVHALFGEGIVDGVEHRRGEVTLVVVGAHQQGDIPEASGTGCAGGGVDSIAHFVGYGEHALAGVVGDPAGIAQHGGDGHLRHAGFPGDVFESQVCHAVGLAGGVSLHRT